MALNSTEQGVLFGIIAETFGVIGTIGRVELIPDEEEREEARRTDYAALAGTVIAGAIVGAIALAIGEPE